MLLCVYLLRVFTFVVTAVNLYINKFEMEINSGTNNKRTTNYTKEECWRVIEVIENYADVIENKKTDALTWKQKVSKLLFIFTTGVIYFVMYLH